MDLLNSADSLLFGGGSADSYYVGEGGISAETDDEVSCWSYLVQPEHNETVSVVGNCLLFVEGEDGEGEVEITPLFPRHLEETAPSVVIRVAGGCVSEVRSTEPGLQAKVFDVDDQVTLMEAAETEQGNDADQDELYALVDKEWEGIQQTHPHILL